MSVSVVIPTTLSRDVVQRSVESVVRSAERVPGAEVILVVNGHAGRHTPRIGSPVLRVVETDLTGVANARNIGFERARHDATLCTDDDCVVPEEWCVKLLRTLQSGVAAVAAPVDVEVRGPITAFMDYQRLFDAPPLPDDLARCPVAPNLVRFPVTANCGVRRDLLPPGLSFEPTLQGGEDTEYGLRVRDAGHDWQWCEPRVLHLIAEDIGQITDRWQGYGEANARLFLRFGRWQTCQPHAIDSYRRLSRGILGYGRQFGELVDHRVQRTFAVLNVILASSWLAGYLAGAGEGIGIQLVTLDAEALSAGLREAAEPALAAAPASMSAWRAPLIDLRELPDRLAQPVPLPDAEVAAVLRRHAPLADDARVAEAEPVLDRWADRFRERTVAAIARVRDAAGELHAMQQPTAEDLRRVLREHALPFGDGLLGIERMASPAGLTTPWSD